MNDFKIYQIPKNDSQDTVKIRISAPRLRAENLTLITWGSSFVLASQLHHIKIHPEALRGNGIKLLELGAGTGLVGLSAAAIWRTEVILTELAPIVPGLAANISLNKHVLAQKGGSAKCGTLDWNQPASLFLHGSDTDTVLSHDEPKASVILAADTAYDEDQPALLSNVAKHWLAPGEHSRFIICYPLRVAYLDIIRDMWEKLESIGLEAIEEGKAETGGEDDWDDEKLNEWSVWRWRKA